MGKTYKRWIPVIGKISMETKRVWSVALVTGVELCLHLKQFPAVAKLSKLIFNSILLVQRPKEIKTQFLNFTEISEFYVWLVLTRNLSYVERRPFLANFNSSPLRVGASTTRCIPVSSSVVIHSKSALSSVRSCIELVSHQNITLSILSPWRT